MPPLSLEDAKEGTFLETTFEITAANTIRRWVKNEAKTGESWKYAHYKSHSSRTQKRAVLVACLRKIHLMANDVGGLYFSAIKKLKEFENLVHSPEVYFDAHCDHSLPRANVSSETTQRTRWAPSAFESHCRTRAARCTQSVSTNGSAAHRHGAEPTGAQSGEEAANGRRMALSRLNLEDAGKIAYR